MADVDLWLWPTIRTIKWMTGLAMHKFINFALSICSWIKMWLPRLFVHQIYEPVWITKMISSIRCAGGSSGTSSACLFIPPPWESLVESDVPVSWGSTGRKLCGPTRSFYRALQLNFAPSQESFAVKFLADAWSLFMAGLQEGKPGYQVQVQSFRRPSFLFSLFFES